MPRIIACLLALAFALPLGAAPVPKHLFPKDQPLYFPTQVGAEWVYDDDGSQYKFAVTKVEQKENTTLVTVGISFRDGTTQHSYTVEVSKSGIRETLNFNRKIEPPTPLLKLPCAKGDKWECPFSLNGEKRADYTFTAGGIEVIKVPAGTFQALRVDSVSTDVTGKETQTITTWYAPDVGPVRIAYRPGSSRDLVKFTPGKVAPAKK
ncbi:MAG: DUF3108 domain-containing protein [Planctomycetia bacterium]|nr:DUF3108 domain-containing protein [Planctomycetia bacterium]